MTPTTQAEKTAEQSLPSLLPNAQQFVFLTGSTTKQYIDDANTMLGGNLASVEVKRFSDGELSVKVPTNVRDRDIYLLHSLSKPVNESLMELCLTLDALTKASAKRVTVILPYMAYARSDRRMEGREPIAAQLVARFIEAAGAHRLIVLDLHSEQVQGFFRIPVDNIYGTNVLMPAVLNYLREQAVDPATIVVVSPDAGGAKRARAVAKTLGARFALIDKMRPRANEVEGMVLLGDVQDEVCLMVDDMVDTAGTLCAGAQLLKEKGAKQIIAACTHPLLSGQSQQKIEDSAISKFFVTDSVPLPTLTSEKLTVVSLGKFLAEVIRRESCGESMQDLRRHGLSENAIH